MNRMKMRRLTSLQNSSLEKVIEKKFEDLVKRHRLPTESRNRKLFKGCWLIVCMIGCMIQGYIITMDYMSYREVANIRMLAPKLYENSALSICLDPIYIVKQSCVWTNKNVAQLYSKYNNTESNETHVCVPTDYLSPLDFVQRSLNITGQVHILGISWGSMNTWIDDVPMKTYLKSHEKCLMIDASTYPDYPNSGIPMYVELKAENFLKNQMSSIEFNVLVHDNRNWPSEFDTYPISISYYTDFSRNYYTLILQRLTTKFLKYPFESNCIDYPIDNVFRIRGHPNTTLNPSLLNSSGQCISHCALFTRLVNNRCLDPFLVSTDNFDPNCIPTCPEWIPIDDICDVICKLDCSHVRYVLSPRSNSNMNPDMLTMKILTDLPETIIHYQPYTELVSYLIFIASIFSLWLGSSVYGSPIWIVESLYHLIE